MSKNQEKKEKKEKKKTLKIHFLFCGALLFVFLLFAREMSFQKEAD
jgi:hypothetical protein